MTTESQPSETATNAVEFTYDWYEEFLKGLLDGGYRPAEYTDDLGEGDVIVRHDVDFSPRKALTMGHIEADLGISATYFLLVTSPLYDVFHRPNRQVIAELQSLGHDVGLHFSTHQYWSDEPPIDELTERVEAERCALETVASGVSEAVSFHRPPEWIFRRAFDGFVSTYEDRFFTDVAYRGDSNQRWREEHPLAGGAPDTLQILTHPGLWGETDEPFGTRLRTEIDYELERTRRFMEEQLIEKKYNIDEFQHQPERVNR